MTELRELRDRLNQLSHVIIGAPLDVHREVGPGMLGSAYEACLAFELSRRGLAFEKQKPLPLQYKAFASHAVFDWTSWWRNSWWSRSRQSNEFRKFTGRSSGHYLKQTQLHLGLLINFNVPLADDGIHRVVNGFPE